MKTPSIADPEVAAVFESFPEGIRRQLFALRTLILGVGTRVDPIAKVSESLKWGEPSYTTISGSPVRLGCKRDDTERFAVYFHCQTKLISTFRHLYPNTFTFEGNRAILFNKDEQVPMQELEKCIELAPHTINGKTKRFLRSEEHQAKWSSEAERLYVFSIACASVG